MLSFSSTFSIFYLVLYQLCNSDVINQIGRIYIEDTGFPAAENIAIDTDNNRIFAADGSSIALNVLSYTLSSDLSSSTMTLEKVIHFDIPFTQYTPNRNMTLSDVPSVQYSPKGYIVASTITTEYAIDYGWLAFVNRTDLTIFHMLEIDLCYLPDHISISNDGRTLIISCEGEPDDNEAEYPTYNPPGSVAIVDVSSDNIDEWTVYSANFEAFNDNEELINDLYITHQNESLSINAEPEYSVIDNDNKYGYISLQEQNAIGVLDIDKRMIVDIYPLGFNDYSVYGLDASDKDNAINIKTYPNLYGMRAPDAIDYLLSDAKRHYLFTANEGDTKDFDEIRVKDLILSNTTFGDYNITDLQKVENLGRLKVSNLYGYNELNEYEKLYTFSSRDFTIWEIIFDDNKPSRMELIYSSNNIFELVTSDALGLNGFNSDYFNPSFDERSDAKGPEPEAIVVGRCNNGRKYVFIGMERAGGIFVFDITLIDDGYIEYIEYFHAQNYSAIWEEDTRSPSNAGDIGPEQMRFIDESVYGVPLLVVAYPESSSVAMYRIDCGEASVSPNAFPSDPPSIISTEPIVTSVYGDDLDYKWMWIGIGIGSGIICGLLIVIGLCLHRKKAKKRGRPLPDDELYIDNNVNYAEKRISNTKGEETQMMIGKL